MKTLHAAALALVALLPAAARAETPLVPYEVVEPLGEGMEVRRYADRAAVETDAGDGTSGAFRRLFKYIDGGNAGGAEIAMTAPVETGPPGRKIEMTAPVETTAGPGKVMRFFLPEGMTADTAPRPVDPAVRVVVVPGGTEAVLRFSGLYGVEGALERAPELAAALEGAGWTATGPARTYFYDPPWRLPWNRRNEVVIPVERAAGS